MTTTWAKFLSDVRAELKDDGGTQKWSDDVLLLWTIDAIRDYSSTFPRVMERVPLTLDSASYPLPQDFIGPLYVECPADRVLSRRAMRPGRRYYNKGGRPTVYYISNDRLYLNGDPGSDEVLLTYEAIHLIPASVNDTAFEFSVPDRDIELIRIYVRAKALEIMRSKQSTQDRYKLGSGKRDDNPLEPEVADLMSVYHHKMAKRYRGRTHFLHRLRGQA